MLRDAHIIRLDSDGRIKLPSSVRSEIETRWGSTLYITSLDGLEVRIYPIQVWEEIEAKLAKAPSMNPSIIKFTDRTAYYGRTCIFDKQGRAMIHPLLRKSASLEGEEVTLLGKHTYLTMMNHQIFQERRLAQPITPEDYEVFQSFGI